MPWVKLDDKFPEHPKVLKAGPVAAWLHVRAIAYCNRHLTDGFISHETVRSMNGQKSARTLVQADLWEIAPGGFHIHDYLDYQPSRADTVAKRRRMSELGRKGGHARGEQIKGGSAAPSAPSSVTPSEASGAMPSAQGTQAANPRSPKPGPVEVRPVPSEPLAAASAEHKSEGPGEGETEVQRLARLELEVSDPLVKDRLRRKREHLQGVDRALTTLRGEDVAP